MHRAGCCGGHPASVRALLAAGARTNLPSRQGTWSRPPLLAALIARDADSARLLLDARANANVETTGGRSALMLAASIPDLELTRALLRRRADLCHHDSRGLSAVAVARVHGNEAVFELLLKAAKRCEALTEAGE
ncbi:MAG: ankyrin repeat domain-containing protein [Candidatus Binatia bacterium]